MKLFAAAALIAAIPLCGVSQQPEAGTSAKPSFPFLRAKGAAIVDEREQPVTLRGCNLGNWLLFEMWMMGLSREGDPKDHWELEELLKKRFGAAEKDRLLDVFRENWITRRDFETIRFWNFNVVRLPFYYGLLEDDAAPGRLRPDAFKWLDRAIEMASQAGLYVILDMHGAPGGQSTDHCTGRSGENKLWLPENRKRAAFLWQKIAERYRDNAVVAAYDLLNEPYGDFDTQPDNETLVATMDELIRAIRAVDQKHLILCAGSTKGILMYGPPASRGWENVGYTEHFYPGLFGDVPSLETHARFLSQGLPARAGLLRTWDAPFLAGEFNVVLEKAGGAPMMRRYYDTFAANGWAATMWTYKMLKERGGSLPDNWYMVSNAEDLEIPSLKTASAREIERFFRVTGKMAHAQDEELRAALTTADPPALKLHEYPLLSEAAPQDPPMAGWKARDVGEPFVQGGQRITAEGIEVFGGGRDVYEGRDEFHFVARPVSGDFNLRAGLTPPLDTHRHAKAGLMYRQTAEAGAPLVMICLMPDGSCTFAFRRRPGERITELRLAPGNAAAVSLVRTGNIFEATAWDKDGKEIAAQSADVPELPADGDLSLFVCSHDALLLSKAEFSKIEFVSVRP